jgi:ABC-type multidrug transport system fused ATPase/permease subunit
VYSLQLTVLLQWTVRLTIDAETNATSVERLLAFVDITSEKSVAVAVVDESVVTGEVTLAGQTKEEDASLGDVELGVMAAQSRQEYVSVSVTDGDEPVSQTVPAPAAAPAAAAVWPSKGDITFDNLKIRYRPDLSLVLHGERRPFKSQFTF